MLTVARRKGAELRRQSREKEKEVRKIVIERLKEKERLNKEKETKSKEKHLNILNDVISQGGLCTSKDDVDKLMADGGNRSENLKAQIRYRKLVLGESLKMSGTVNELYKTLLNCIGYEATSPPPKKRKVDS